MKRLLLFLLFFALLLSHAGAERLFILSDLHFKADSETQELREAVCAKLLPEDTLLVLGDMANSGREAEHARVYSFLCEIRETVGCPVYVLPGNHDLSGGVSPEGFAELYASFGYMGADWREGGSYARILPSGLLLVMLDTNGYDPVRKDVQHGAVSESQLAWLKELLSTRPAGMETIVCGHYPILPAESGGSDETANAEALGRLLRDAGVRVYLCGHRHSNFTLEEDGLRQIGVGVPFAWPACGGSLMWMKDRFIYEMVPLYAEGSETMKTMRQEQLALARRMAEGSLQGTTYEGDGAAIDWFVTVFLSSMEGTLEVKQGDLLAHEGYNKWQLAEVRSMAKPWILSLVEHPPEDVKHIEIESVRR